MWLEVKENKNMCGCDKSIFYKKGLGSEQYSYYTFAISSKWHLLHIFVVSHSLHTILDPDTSLFLDILFKLFCYYLILNSL